MKPTCVCRSSCYPRKSAGPALLLLSCLLIGVNPAWSKTEKPTLVAADFFRSLTLKQFDEAAALLCTADHQAAAELRKNAAAQKAQAVTLEKVLEESFFLLFGQQNAGMVKKNQDGETIMPQRIGFYVPGQYYEIGKFAVVFTRETYEIARADTGPVRDDPRKLWIDPTNALSKVRDEAYFKQWWVWEGDSLTMPGLVWMIKERNAWKIDFFGTAVPRKAFDKILFWHFGRSVFETEGEKPAASGAAPSGPKRPEANPFNRQKAKTSNPAVRP